MTDRTQATEIATGESVTASGPDFSAYVFDPQASATQTNSESSSLKSVEQPRSDADLVITPLWTSQANSMSAEEPSKENIPKAAEESDGDRLWKGARHEGAVDGGNLGSAVLVSEILKNSGIAQSEEHLSIGTLEQKLKDLGFEQKKLSDAKPGNIVIHKPGANNQSRNMGH